MNTSVESKSVTAKGGIIDKRFCNNFSSAGGGCWGFCCICRMVCPNFHAVGVSNRKTTRNAVIPITAPITIHIDQVDTRLNWFGGPSFIVNANNGPKIRVKAESIWTDRVNLGKTFRTNSPLACGENFASEGLTVIKNVRAAPDHPITENM